MSFDPSFISSTPVNGESARKNSGIRPLLGSPSNEFYKNTNLFKTRSLISPVRSNAVPRRYSLSDINITPPNNRVAQMRSLTRNNSILSSSRYNINSSVLLDSRSPGYSSRIIQYSEEKEKEKSHPTHQSKYDSPGVFPIVHLFKKDLPVLKHKPNKVTVRIASPELSRYNTPEHNRLLLEKIVHSRNKTPPSNEVNTRSVLDALKEISRKRIHSSEEEYNLRDDGKRIRMDCTSGGEYKKRQREEASPQSDGGSPQLGISKKLCSLDELVASQSSTNQDSETTTNTKVEESVCKKPTDTPKKRPNIRKASEVHETPKNRPKLVHVETQTIAPKFTTTATDPDPEPKELEPEPEPKKTEVVPKPKKPSPVKIFDEKPLEIMRKNRLSVLIGAPIPKRNPDVDKSGKEHEKPLVSILAGPNKSPRSSTKHVTFNIEESSSNESDIQTIFKGPLTQTSAALATPIVSSVVSKSPTKPETVVGSTAQVTPFSATFNFSPNTKEMDETKNHNTTLSQINTVNSVITFGTTQNDKIANTTNAVALNVAPTTTTGTTVPSFSLNAIATSPTTSKTVGGFKFDLRKPVATTSMTTQGSGFSLTNPQLTTHSLNVSSNPATISTNKPFSFNFTSTQAANTTTPTMPSFGMTATSDKPATFLPTTSNGFAPTTTLNSFTNGFTPSSTPNGFAPISTSNSFTPSTRSSSFALSPTSSSFTISKPPVFGFSSTPSTTMLHSSPSIVTTQSMFGGTATSTTSSGFKPSFSFSATTTASAAPTFPQTTSFGSFGGTQNPGLAANSVPFGQTPAPSFGTVTSTPFAVTTASTPFGATATFGNTSTAAFGSTSAPFGATTTTMSPFGGATATVALPFGGSNTTPFGNTSIPFGATTTTTPSFGSTTSNAFGTSATSAFGVPATTTASFGVSSTNMFSPKATTAFGGTTASNFGQNQSAFGAPITTSSFNNTTTATFGSNAFGSTSTGFGAASTAAPAFGAATTTAPAFGAATTAAPAFGAATTTAPAFGTATTTAPAFGAATATAPGFGGATATAPSFGAATTTASAFGAPTTAAPAFGASATAAPTFGASSNFNNTFQSSFGTSAPKVAENSSSFGSTFGSGTTFTNAFNPPTTTQSGVFSFGSANTTKPVFSFGSNEAPKPSFNFSNGTPAFGGSGTSGFGATPSNTFGAGAAPSFGAAAPGGAAPGFGAAAPGGAAPGFGAAAPGGAAPGFGAAPPSFGATPQFNAPGMFNIGTGSVTPTSRSRTQLKAKRRT